MATMQVNREVIVNKPAEEVYKKISDFNHWKHWSPWLIVEPDADVKINDDGKYYEWKGKVVGSGNMTVLKEDENKSVDYDLTFLTPYKSKAKVGFRLTPVDGGTKVQWTLESKLPFFMFWMKKSMEAYIGMDYQRGLEMLKDYVEDGKVHSNLEFQGKSTFEGTKYIGIQRHTTIDKVGDQMTTDFEKLMPFVHENHKEMINGDAFSIYHQWNIPKNKVSYTSCVPVKEIPADLSSEFVSGELPKLEVHTVKHTGPYRHVGNAWSAQEMWSRSKQFKRNKSVDPFEVYLNSPKETDEKELQSEIHFAVK